jgi:hypothetical protein
MSPPRTRFAPDLFELDDRDVPTVVALPDYYKANAGQVLNIPATRGVLANDFSDISAEAVLRADLQTFFNAPAVSYFDFAGPTANVLANPLPANTLTLNPDGSFRLIVPSNVPTNAQGLVFSYTATNPNNPTEPAATTQVLVYLGRPTAARFAVAPQAGAEPRVNVYEVGSGTLVRSFLAYEREFTGGVRVAVADLNADGVPDVITAPGEGGGDRVKVFDGRTDRVLFDSFVFGPTPNPFIPGSFTGGAYVAAGDVNGDGFDDLIVGAGVGGGPRVVVINGQGLLSNQPTVNNPFGNVPGANQAFVVTTGNVLMNFFAYEPEYRGGVKVAAGDVAGVGRDFIITAPGAGGGPVVRTFDFNTVVGPPSIVLSGGIGNNTALAQPIFQYGINANGTAEPTLSFVAGEVGRRDGVNIAAGGRGRGRPGRDHHRGGHRPGRGVGVRRDERRADLPVRRPVPTDLDRGHRDRGVRAARRLPPAERVAPRDRPPEHPGPEPGQRHPGGRGADPRPEREPGRERLRPGRGDGRGRRFQRGRQGRHPGRGRPGELPAGPGRSGPTGSPWKTSWRSRRTS